MLTIYTDGSARYANQQSWIGACAFTIHYHTQTIYQTSYNLIPATINECELMAVINAIYVGYTKYHHHQFQIYTDSQYVLTGVNKSSHNQHTNLWQIYESFLPYCQINIQHVKSHQDPHNKQVDKLAKTKLRSQFN